MTMTFARRSLFGRTRARDFTKVDDLVAAVQDQLAIEEAGPGDAEAIRGQLAGALTSGPATIARDPTIGSPRFRAGFMAGHLHAHLIRTMGPLRWESILPTTVYAASLLAPELDRFLGGSGPNIVAAHTSACLRAADRGDMPLDVELATFRWLAAQHSIAVTPELVERFDDARSRRLELQVALDSERTLDASGARASRAARHIREHIVRLERQIAVMDPGSSETDRWRGALTGLQVSESGPFLAAMDDGASESYRGGRFGGDLLASLIRDDRVPIEALRSICYRYGAALATPAGGTLMAEAPPTNALKAHALGMHVLSGGGPPVDEDLEIALLSWLAGRLEVSLTHEFLESRKRFVARRRTPD
jgi:hypothetical protein